MKQEICKLPESYRLISGRYFFSDNELSWNLQITCQPMEDLSIKGREEKEWQRELEKEKMNLSSLKKFIFI